MLFIDNEVGNWRFRLIDESGHILNKKALLLSNVMDSLIKKNIRSEMII